MHKKRRTKGRKGSKVNRFSNLLNGLATCYSCGSAMVHNDKGKSRSGKRWVYLQCSKARAGGDCEYISIKYDNLEYNLLKFLRGADFHPVFNINKLDQNVVDGFEHKIAITKAEILIVDKKYKEWVSTSSSAFEDVKKEELGVLEQKKIRLLKELKDNELSLSELLINSTKESINRPEFNELLAKISSDYGGLDIDQLYFNRVQVNDLISKVVQSIKACCKTRILFITYKNESMQMINISQKFDHSSSIIPVIDIPRINFPECMLSTEIRMYKRIAINTAQTFLEQMISLENDDVFTQADGIKLKQEYQDYLYNKFEDMLLSDGYYLYSEADELNIVPNHI